MPKVKPAQRVNIWIIKYSGPVHAWIHVFVHHIRAWDSNITTVVPYAAVTAELSKPFTASLFTVNMCNCVIDWSMLKTKWSEDGVWSHILDDPTQPLWQLVADWMIHPSLDVCTAADQSDACAAQRGSYCTGVYLQTWKNTQYNCTLMGISSHVQSTTEKAAGLSRWKRNPSLRAR